MRALLLVALLLAGCATPTNPAETVAPEAIAAPPPPAPLYLEPDGTLGAAPPREESSVPVPSPATTPVTTKNPEWTGARPQGNFTDARLILFVTSSSVSLAASSTPFTQEFPRFVAYLNVKDAHAEGQGPGPTALRAGEVVEVTIPITLANGTGAAGDPMTLRAIAWYSHVAKAGEVRFVMGPEHPARIEWEASPQSSTTPAAFGRA